MIELTLEDFKFFSEKQEILDEAIKKQKGITNEEWKNDLSNKHSIALYIERAEFANECSDLWKYWKDKKPNLDKVLDEAIDVIHFVFLTINKHKDSLDLSSSFDIYKYILEKSTKELDEFKDKELYIASLFASENELEVLGKVLYILDLYGLTRDDVIAQYKKKNAVNFERLESGY